MKFAADGKRNVSRGGFKGIDLSEFRGDQKLADGGTFLDVKTAEGGVHRDLRQRHVGPVLGRQRSPCFVEGDGDDDGILRIDKAVFGETIGGLVLDLVEKIGAIEHFKIEMGAHRVVIEKFRRDVEGHPAFAEFDFVAGGDGEGMLGSIRRCVDQGGLVVDVSEEAGVGDGLGGIGVDKTEGQAIPAVDDVGVVGDGTPVGVVQVGPDGDVGLVVYVETFGT